MTSSDSASAHPVTRPAQVAGSVAQLAALGVVGPILLTIVLSMLGLGVALLFVLGIGLLVLIALVYVLYALGWLETQRVDGSTASVSRHRAPAAAAGPVSAASSAPSGSRRSTPRRGGRSRTWRSRRSSDGSSWHSRVCWHPVS
jgi:Na+-transporting methylmalonyl-CoA/oxaloacetate decarboxylase gamma subunit